MTGRPFKVGHSRQTIESWPWWAGYGRLAVQNQEAVRMGRMAGWSGTALRSSIRTKISLMMNGEIHETCSFPDHMNLHRTYEAMGDCWMCKGIHGRQLGSTWGN